MAEGAREEGGGVVKEAEERWREGDDGGRVRTAEKPHPLAGRKGEGAPLSPPGWLWRAGNRTRDMYFISPSGQKFRSQLHLHAYLASIPDPPPMSLFRWKVDPHEFKDGVLPGVLSQDRQPSARKKAKLDGAELSAEKFYVKKTGSQPQMKVNLSSLQKSNGQPVHLSMKSPDTIGFSSKVGPKTHSGPEKINKKKSDHRSKKETSNTTFTHLLFTPTSYKVLSKNAKVLQRFLNEAALLKEKDEKEVGNLRNLLLMKKYNAAQLSKYPESVLRVFFYILRYDEAPATIEKRELIEFCCNWICKHKHHWCLLETRRLDIFETFFSETLIDHNRTVCWNSSTLKENACHFVREGAKDSADQQGTHGANGIPKDCTERSCVGTDMSSKGGIESTFTENGVFVPESGETALKMGAADTVDRGLSSTTVDSAMNFDNCWSKETIQMNPNDFYATSHSGRESTEEAKFEQRQLAMHEECKPRSNTCGCQVCSSDRSFCYGCTCNLCKLCIQHNQTGTFLKCPICRHFCHLECALKARRAGVVVELGMDGELLCLCCSNKSDLVPFWVEMLKNALTNIDRPMVLKYLTSAVLVLNGTERKNFQSVHQSVMELHDSLLYNTPCPNLQQILRQIQEKVDSLNSRLKRTACVFGVDVQDPEFLQEEEKLLEGQARAELHYVEWLIAEKNADTQRINLRNAQEEMKKAELDISTKAVHARSSRKFIQQAERRLHLMKRNIAVQALSKEQLEKQRAALELELVELNKVRNQLGSFSAEPREISAALQDFRIQSKRVENMKVRLGQIDSLKNFFS